MQCHYYILLRYMPPLVILLLYSLQRFIIQWIIWELTILGQRTKFTTVCVNEDEDAAYSLYSVALFCLIFHLRSLHDLNCPFLQFTQKSFLMYYAAIWLPTTLPQTILMAGKYLKHKFIQIHLLNFTIGLRLDVDMPGL